MNPWAKLPDSAPFVLDEDRPEIDAFNGSPRGLDDRFAIHLEVPPSPFTGSLTGSLVLLNLNPAFDDRSEREFSEPEYREAILSNLRQDPIPHQFVVLDPAWSNKGGHRWWSRIARALVEVVGLDAVTANLLVVEWFPYHSRKFPSRPPSLPSQQFGFDVVRGAIQRGAVIVAMRSFAKWKAAVPELKDHDAYFELRNVQNPTLSPGNCPEDGFALMVEALRK